MGYYKELDIERIHSEEAENRLLASIQPTFSEDLLSEVCETSNLESFPYSPSKSGIQSLAFYQ
ncbi:MAG: hypothetical protein JSU04_20315 [Bdellovibrionales bacterium]|nr:hypothetical protein [Bdellovibrionales bacterium]